MSNNTTEGQNIVSLVPMIEEIRFPAVTELEAYWNDLRGTRAVPMRSEIDPRRIEDCLEFAFILERIAPGLARFRLAGTHLNDLIGMEVRGMPITSIFAPSAREKMGEALEEVFTGPSVVSVSVSADRGFGKPPLDGRLLLLPLKSDFGDVSRALGCLVTSGQIGRAPRRFVVKELQKTAITSDLSGTPVAPADRKPTPEPRPAAGLAEPKAPFQGAPRQAQPNQAPRPPFKGKPNLRLIKSDD
ncbi:MAG: PAS domain-containing protein [Pseudomonadota bacterium]